MDYSFLDNNLIVPVVVINKIEDCLPTLEGLKKGGINCAEITFRTACAEDAIKLASKNISGMVIGAGTIVNRAQCLKAVDAGAKFIVSPGFSYEVYEACQELDIPYLPGVVTPTEIISAKDLGLTVLKYFPASVFGGVKGLKAIASVFQDIKFMPTGGIDESNLAEYLKLPNVISVGGSFMFKNGIENIENISKNAVEIAKSVR